MQDGRILNTFSNRQFNSKISFEIETNLTLIFLSKSSKDVVVFNNMVSIPLQFYYTMFSNFLLFNYKIQNTFTRKKTSNLMFIVTVQ